MTPWSWLDVLSRTDARRLITASPLRQYVYVLVAPDGTPFYVGRGVGERVFQHEATAWNTTLRSHKLNLIRRIRRDGGELRYALCGFFAEAKACDARERELIALFGRHDRGRGPLTNQLDGGEGPSNPSAEVQARHRASLGGEAEDPDRRAANQFLAGIAGGQDSVPIKPWSTLRARAHLLRPSPKKTETPTYRPNGKGYCRSSRRNRHDA